MNIALTIIGLLMAVLVFSSVMGLYWAGKTGQFQNLEAGARVIFDEDEPIGMATDEIFKKKIKRSHNSDI